MKELQDDFTTPEQSQRLLEFGVPADSANMLYCRSVGESWGSPQLCLRKYSKYSVDSSFEMLPCWSAGRLIEILAICCKNPMFYIHRTLVIESGMVDYCMRTFANSVKLKIIDFSKLEEQV